MLKLKPNLLAFALASAGIGCAFTVNAADEAATGSSDAADAQALDAITVTGNRRVQSIQEYAGTVQSISGEDLQRLGVNTDFRNLQSVVPGLQITRQEGKYEVFLRGIGSTDSDFSSDPSVATYYNGIYLPRPRSIGPMFFDAERVEVNKGPQGTVRGRNATGGSINVISNKPLLGEFGGNLQVGAGNYGSRTYEGAVNIPVGETLALRAAVFNESHDAYIKNAYPADFDAPGALDVSAARVSMLWQPNDRFSAYILADKVDEQGSGDPGAFSGRALSAGYDIDDLDDPWRQYIRGEGRSDNDIEGIAATFTYNFDKFSVEYNTSWRKYDFYNQNASREWQLGMVYPGSKAEAYHNPERLQWYDTFFQADESSSTINELRFFGETDRLIWSTGVFLYNEKFDYLSWDVGNGYFGDCGWFKPNTVCGWQNGLGGENRGDDSEVESNAFYADLNFSLRDDLRLIGGVRYTDDKKTAHERNYQYQFVIPNGLFEQFGLSPNYNTGPWTTGLVIGSPGFALTAPGGRRLHNPNICSGWSPGSLVCNGGTDNSVDFFLDGIAQFGLRDNWGEFLRKYKDQIEVIIRSDYPGGKATNEYSDDYVDWRAGVEYDLADDRMLYFTVSTGTRSGGVNRPLVLGNGQLLARTWKPEELTSYELGIKNDLMWGETPVRLNAALFYYDYQNKVVQNLIAVPAPTPGNPSATQLHVFSDNAAEAEVLGLEFEGQFAFDHGLDFTWNYSYLDATFKNSPILDTRSGSQNLIVNIDGNRLPNTSEHNLNMTLSQVIPVTWGAVKSVDWSVNMMYRSDYYLSAFNSKGYGTDANGNVIEIPLANMPVNNGSNPAQAGGPANGMFLRDDVGSFAVFNATVGMNFGDFEQFRIDVYGSNLTNEAFSGKGFINDSVNIRYLNTPRTFGLRFTATF